MTTPPEARIPVLSVVLIARHPLETPDAVLAALSSGMEDLSETELLEVILVDGRDDARKLHGDLPDPLKHILRPGLNMPRLKAAGLAVAQAGHVAFLEPKAVPVKGWSRAAVDALAANPGAALGGPVVRKSERAVDGAAYAFEYSAFSESEISKGRTGDLPGNNMILPAVELRRLCKDVLSTEGLNKPFCQARLTESGVRIVMIPEMAVQIRTAYRLGNLLSSRYQYARCFGGTRAALASPSQRWIYLLGAPIVPFLLLYRHIGANLRAESGDRLGVIGLAALSVLCMAWSAGEAAGSWFGSAKSCDCLY